MSLINEGLDHLAIVVADTDTALSLWNVTLGFPVITSQVVNDGSVKLTHLDLGNVQLQLVEPLTPDHPLKIWLAQNGSGLHHLCFKVADVGEAASSSPIAALGTPHEGIDGKRAIFLNKEFTQNIVVELTGA